MAVVIVWGDRRYFFFHRALSNIHHRKGPGNKWMGHRDNVSQIPIKFV